jgi:hypothetical protein
MQELQEKPGMKGESQTPYPLKSQGFSVGPGPITAVKERTHIGSYLDELETMVETCHEAFTALEGRLDPVIVPRIPQDVAPSAQPQESHSWVILNIERKIESLRGLRGRINDTYNRLET